MKAIAKTRPAPGVDLINADEPEIRPGCVKVRIECGSVCGTDLHIFQWDPWSANRIHPPRIIGHEFCGTILEIGEGVDDRAVGQFISSESHIVCGECVQCLHGQGHVCANTRILGVDVDGGFSEVAVIPAMNARPCPPGVPREVAGMKDALGNAVHTVMAGPIEGRDILITGMGPIGLFAVAICRAMGARTVVATEISDFRMALARRLGADAVINPRTEDLCAAVRRIVPKGFDATLEMSGHPAMWEAAVEFTRPGGRISLLGVYRDVLSQVDLNKVIFKGIDVQGIVGRRLWETWDQMAWLLEEKQLDVTPVITHHVPFTEVSEAMRVLGEGQAGKIVLDFASA